MQDAQEDLIQFMYQAPVGLCQTDMAGKIRFATPMAAQLLMPLTRDSALDNIFDALDDVAPELRNAVIGFSKKRGQIVTEHRCAPVGAGADRSRALSISVVKIAKDRLAIAINDVTTLLEKEQEATRSGAMVHAIGEILKGVEVSALDNDGAVAHWNRTGEQLNGRSALEMVGQSYGVLVLNEHEQAAVGGALFDPTSATADASHLTCNWETLLEQARESGSARMEGPRLRKNGEPFWAETVLTRLRRPDGGPGGFSVITRDVTNLRRREKALLTLARTDPLTGALNRRAFFELATFSIDAVREQGGVYAVAIADLDKFKAVNDTYGHGVGDQVLAAFAQRMQGLLRDSDLLGRFGGEEFVIYFDGLTLDEACARAEALRAATEAMSVASGGDEVRFTVSIGVAQPETADELLTALINRADSALYEAKSNGRNRVESAAPLAALSA